MGRFLFVWCLMVLWVGCSAQKAARQKVIDEGGLGKYPAIVTEDIAFPGYTIYRPADMEAVDAFSLPLVVFGNGGCMNNSLAFEKMLNELSSFGYVVVAVGPYYEDMAEAEADEYSQEWTDHHLLIEAIDLMEKAVKNEHSVFYGKVNMQQVAVMGQSCGGLQALAVSNDPRVKTTICLNSGVIAPEGENLQDKGRNLIVDKSVLRTLHAPVLYLVGGKEDIAYENALDDFSRIDNVFTVLASDNSGHMGTYADEFGGTYGQLVVRWCEWMLRGEEWAASVFIGDECICAYPGWDAQFKNKEKLTLP